MLPMARTMLMRLRSHLSSSSIQAEFKDKWCRALPALLSDSESWCSRNSVCRTGGAVTTVLNCRSSRQGVEESLPIFTTVYDRRAECAVHPVATSLAVSHQTESFELLRQALQKFRIKHVPGYTGAHRYQHSVSDEELVRHWMADKKRREKQRRVPARPRTVFADEVSSGDIYHQNESLMPTNPEEGKIAGVLGRPDLIITRNVEWANIAFGFEQQNKYVIMDPREPQAPVGFILEDSNIFMRQFLRRRRPFVAFVLDAAGSEVCRVRRPFWLINSSIYVEIDGKVIGEVHRRWHLWRRVYDVYLGSKQFAAVENPGFWYWTFTLKDETDGILAVIDRNWRGFGYEFLTDAGQYVVRFGGDLPQQVRQSFTPQLGLTHARVGGRPILTGSSSSRTEMQNLRTAAEQVEDLVVSRPLSLSERAITLALAVSLDNDYFSNHSSGFGFIPLPFFGGSEAADT